MIKMIKVTVSLPAFVMRGVTCAPATPNPHGDRFWVSNMLLRDIGHHAIRAWKDADD